MYERETQIAAVGIPRGQSSDPWLDTSTEECCNIADAARSALFLVEGQPTTGQSGDEPLSRACLDFKIQHEIHRVQFRKNRAWGQLAMFLERRLAQETGIEDEGPLRLSVLKFLDWASSGIHYEEITPELIVAWVESEAEALRCPMNSQLSVSIAESETP